MAMPVGTARRDPLPAAIIGLKLSSEHVPHGGGLPVIFREQRMGPAQRCKTSCKRVVELLDRVGGPRRCAKQGLNGRKRVLHAMVQLANKKMLAFCGGLGFGEQSLSLLLG